MSNEGFRGVPGVPEGWELVAIRRALNGEFILNALCDAEKWSHELSSEYVYPIIRKIEQPAKYRAFANSKEAEPFFDRKLRFKDDRLPGLFRVIAINDSFAGIGVDTYAYPQAFDSYVCEDGTPFGVRVDD